MTSHPKPPNHLRTAGRRLWRAVIRTYALEEHHLVILRAGCEAADRLEDARAAIEADGLTVPARFGPRSHPAIAIERDSRIALLRCVRELGLDIEAPGTPRPPSHWKGR